MEKPRRSSSAKTGSKYKTKEEKETKKAFEAIAQKLIKEQMATFQVQMRSLIARNVESIRSDVAAVESSLSSRLVNLEHKINSINEKVDELNSSTKRTMDGIQEHQTSNLDLIKANLELERNKRAAHVKKLQDKLIQLTTETQEGLQQVRQEQTTTTNSLHEDLRVQARELTLTREKVDELLIARYGYLPKSKSEGRSGSYHQSEPASVLDQIAHRIEKMERAFNGNNGNGEDDSSPYGDISFSAPPGSPSRNNMGQRGTINRIRRLEETVQALQSQVQQSEQQLQVWRTQEQKYQRTDNELKVSETNTRVVLEVKEMEKKIKRLAENTSKACRSLSQGLSDVQQATLNLYSWSDNVHDSFNVVVMKVGLPEGLCPRAKVAKKNKDRRSDQWDD